MRQILLTVAIFFFTTQIGVTFLTNVQPRDIYADAEDLLALLNISLQDATQHYQPLLKRLHEEMMAKRDAVLLTAKAEIAAIHGDIMKRVEAVELQYGIWGIDISNCVSYYRPEIERIPGEVIKEIEQCLEESVTLGEEIVNRAALEIDNLHSVIDKLRLRLDECRILPNGLDCTNRVVEDINIQIFDLPVTIQEDAQRATVVVSALVQRFPECYDERVDSVAIVGNDLYQYFFLCSCCS